MSISESKLPYEQAVLPGTVEDDKRVIVLIIEDNDFENALIKKQIQLLLDSGKLPVGMEFELLSYVDGKSCITDLKAGVFGRSMIIAFIDYYLQKGITGFDLFKVIMSMNQQNKSIFMTQSNEYKLWLRLSKTKAYACVHKDEFLPFKCREILEKIINERF